MSDHSLLGISALLREYADECKRRNVDDAESHKADISRELHHRVDTALEALEGEVYDLESVLLYLRYGQDPCIHK